MHFRIQLIVVVDDGHEHVQEIADVPRGEASLETLGLTLAESKGLLARLQQSMVTQQVATYLNQQRACPHCGHRRPLKERDTAPFRTLFGRVDVPNPRWLHCACQPQQERSFRPLAALLPERTSPELRYLESSWAADASYESATKHLHDAFPLDERHSAVTVRNHTLQAARRAEEALGPEQVMFLDGCQAEWERLPIPDGPLLVGLDGGIVRARRNVTGGARAHLFEVVADKSILSCRRDDPEDTPPESKCFAFVQRFDTKPKRWLFELLTAQGMQANQQVTFFSDGGDTVREVAEQLNPQAEHILDWFHLTMRLTVLRQCARGLAKAKAIPEDERTLERRLESAKHYLWHGTVRHALAGLEDLAMDLECWGCDDEGNRHPQPDGEAAERMLSYVRELVTYITNNTGCIVNYGERYRNGERISTGFVESTINQVVSKRMVKKQQMQWTPEGAHLLLHVRTQVLNGEWEGTFRTWYPGFRPLTAAEQDAA
jgi:DNA-directed RNA polymerase subunit RPC12/RpoP